MSGQYCCKGAFGLMCAATLMLSAGWSVAAAGVNDGCPGIKRALVLGGGGTRGAYQIGAIWYLTKVAKCDFDRFVGTSTGALTAAALSQASSHDDLEQRVDVLVKQYGALKSQGDLVEPYRLGRVRLFLPRWMGGVDGLYGLGAIERRLREQVDPTKLNKERLTVAAVSLQSGLLEDIEPVSLMDFVLGSASLPLAIDPREARLWIRAAALRVDKRTVVLSTPFPPGLPDKDCQIRLSDKVVARCRQVSAKPASSVRTIMSFGKEWLRWHSTVEVSEVEDGAWREFQTRVRETKSAAQELLPLLDVARHRPITLDELIAGWESGVLVQFTTRHQLVDGGVTDNLPVLTALNLRPKVDTLFVLATGEAMASQKTNVEFQGGLNVAARAFDVLWDTYQQVALSSLQRLWLAQSDLGALFLPQILLIEPFRRHFSETLEVNPKAIREALVEGCVAAAALPRALAVEAKLPRPSKFVNVRLQYGSDSPVCEPLRKTLATLGN